MRAELRSLFVIRQPTGAKTGEDDGNGFQQKNTRRRCPKNISNKLRDSSTSNNSHWRHLCQLSRKQISKISWQGLFKHRKNVIRKLRRMWRGWETLLRGRFGRWVQARRRHLETSKLRFWISKHKLDKCLSYFKSICRVLCQVQLRRTRTPHEGVVVDGLFRTIWSFLHF